MLDQRFAAAQRSGVGEQAALFRQTRSAASRPPRNCDAEHAAEIAHLRARQRHGPDATGQAGLVHPFDRRMGGEEFRDSLRALRQCRPCAPAASGSPRSVSQALNGAQHRAGDMAAMRDAVVEQPSRRANTSAPPSTSLWPPKYLVVECMTTSAPSASGAAASAWRTCCRRRQERAMLVRNAWRARAMSQICSSGFDGVSSPDQATSSASGAAHCSRDRRCRRRLR